MASSSFSTRNWKNIVFVSFHGEDSRRGFLSHLYERLTAKGIKTFKDDTELERGEEIEPGLLEAIESSMISIIILTENYAFSTYCLDELVKIMECRKLLGQIVVPIFLNVDPSDVADPTAGVYAEAFSSHRHNVKVETWMTAMKQVAKMGGFPLKPDSSEATLLDAIVADILKKIERTPSDYTQEYVGIDSQIEEIKILLSTDTTPDSVRIIGIMGMGGIGKTTLAKVIYQQIRREFQASSFLSIGEIAGGPVCLIERLLSELLGETIVMNTTFISNSCHAMRLSHRKVLVVVDSVDGLKQWEDLIGTTQFGEGSRIIVTSRNKQLLQKICNEVWEVEKLRPSDASQLFCRHAFKKDCPNKEFKDILGSILHYVGGNPLGLKVLGSFLYGMSKSNWLSAMKRMRKLLHPDIYDVLKISFDGLEQDLQKIFLHIACFFVEWDRCDVMINVLDNCGLSTEIGLTLLKDKCLLEGDPYESDFRMHDLLREMGRQIVRQQSHDLGKHIILDLEDMKQALDKDSVSEEIEGIALNLMDFRDNYCLRDPQAFSKMPNLKFLKYSYFSYMYYRLCEPCQFDKLQFPNGLEYLPDNLRLLHWKFYPLKQLPAQFLPGNLVQLEMPDSKVERLWEGIQSLEKLKELDLSWSSRLIELPDLSSASNIEYIDLIGCKSLVGIPSSWRHLDNLLFLRLSYCSNIKSLPDKISWKSLEKLELEEISELECFPEIECLDGLKKMRITECYNLKSIPSSILRLKSLEKTLDLSGCLNLAVIGEHAYSHSDFHWPREINATNCFSLKILPDLEQVFTFKPRQYYKEWEWDAFNFTNCLAIKEGTRNKMVALAKTKIRSMATYSYFQGKPYEFTMICPGSEIPEWIKHQNMGNFITLQVPIHKSFIGFTLSAVLPIGVDSFNFQLNFKDASGTKFVLERIQKENYHRLDLNLASLQSEHLLLTYTPFVDCDSVVEKIGATDEYYEITFEMSVGYKKDVNVIMCGVVPLYAQSVNEKLETLQSETTQVSINNDYEVYVDKHQVENPDRLIVSRTCQEARLAISQVEHTITSSSHLGTLYYIMGDERSRNMSILSWLSDQRCPECCPRELTCDSSDEDEPLLINMCIEHDDLIFRNCLTVNWSKIMVLAKMRIQAMALCSYFQDNLYNFRMAYPGYEIPKWIEHQTVGNSINIQFSANKRILGFALAFVHSPGDPRYEYKLQFKNDLGDSFDWKQGTFPNSYDFLDSHVSLIYSSFGDYQYDTLVKELGCHEVSCEFFDKFHIAKQPVVKCGMVPLYVGIQKNEELERLLDETSRVIVKLVEEKLEIFVDGYWVKNSKKSIVLKTFQEADIKFPEEELSVSTPPMDALNCIWGDEAQIKEFNQEPQGTDQNDGFLERIPTTPTSRFYELYIETGILYWDDYPMKRLPDYIQPPDLVHLKLSRSEVEKLWEGKKDLKNLKILDLSHSSIVQLPDLSLATNLESIDLSGCKRLLEIPFSMSHLNKLQSLDLHSCKNLKSIPSFLSWKSLKRLNLDGCSKLECFPEIECLDALEELEMRNCSNLKSIPHSIWKLKSLSKFRLAGSCLENLSEINDCPRSSAFRLERPVIGRSYKDYMEYDDFDFSNCSKVDEVIHRQIVALTKMRFQVVGVHRYFQNLAYSSQLVFPRCEMPEWIKHQNESSSITIRLPIDKTFIGFALAVVLPAGWVCFDFELHFRTASDDCSLGSARLHGGDRLLETEHVFITTEIVEELDSIGESYDVTLVVSCRDGYNHKNKMYITQQDVIKCGIVPFYAQNAKCKKLEKRPDESNMVTIHRVDDKLEAFVDGFRVESPDQKVILQTCREAGIEIFEDQSYIEPIIPSKHLGTMYCVWGYEKCRHGCTVCNHCEDEDGGHHTTN